METGFFNPELYPLIFQFDRFGIEMETVFAFTNQPGSTPLSAQDQAAFQAQLNNIAAQYKSINPAFDATAWIKQVLPANYSKTVLVLADPNRGCDFSETTVQYADGSPAQPLDFLKLNLLVRLCNKFGCDLIDGTNPPAVPSNPWTLDEIDNALQAFFPVKNLPAWGSAGFSQAFGNSWKTALVYLAHLDDLNTRLNPALGRVALLPFWEDLPTEGDNPFYSQIFLTLSVLANDPAFDDPAGGFPTAGPDITPHMTAIQGALGLGPSDIGAILTDANVALPGAFSLDNLSICYRYSQLAQCLQLSVSDLISLKTMSGLNPFQALTGNPLAVLADDIVYNQTLAFVKQVAVVQNSGFTVEDLKYLLRHQYDPAGKYKSDPNALISLIQTIAGGIAQIQAQNTVPSDPASMAESLIDQTLSGLFPAATLKNLFAQITNAQTYSASTNSPGPALVLIDPSKAPELTLSFDGVTNTQSVTCQGLLPDWRKAELLALNTNAALNAVFTTLLGNVQIAARTALENSIANVLGVWESLVQYEAVATGVAPAQAITDPLGLLAQADPSLSFTYDAADQIQWLGYRGVLTPAKMKALTAINPSPVFATLLTQVQQLTTYNQLVGSLAAMWCNLKTYKATQTGVAPGSQVDPSAFATALAQATITGPIPSVQLTYDPVAQVQTLTCAGVLTDSMRGQLAALITAPPAVATLLGNLLQTVRTQAVNEFQFVVSSLLAPAVNNPDPFVAPFVGAANLQQQKFAKAQLVAVFVPLLVQKLSRQLVLQTLSSTLGSDPSMTEALVTDAALLNDPNNPGKSLLQTFLAVGQPGVSAYYYDKSSTLLASGTASTTDTADPTNSVAGTVSCHFEGYLEAATDGPYRFFAELGNLGVQAVFRIDSPDPTALITNPVIQATAAKDGDEASQFVQLKGGVAYHFTLDFLNLGAAGAKMLVQGETLPKGPLNQLVLYSQQSVDAFTRAQVLLSKVLEILGVTLLDQRELSYMAANASQFNNLRLSSLPTQASDDSVAKAVALFSQFLTLADYADLRKGPVGGSDGLIDVFQAAATPSGIVASYYASPDETGAPQASGIAAITDTADPSNSKPGTASCRFDGYLLLPSDGTYTFFADLGNAGAKVSFRLDAPAGTAPLANPIVIQKTAAATNEEDSQAVTLTGGVPYHLTLDFQSLGAAGAKLLISGRGPRQGPTEQRVALSDFAAGAMDGARQPHAAYPAGGEGCRRGIGTGSAFFEQRRDPQNVEHASARADPRAGGACGQRIDRDCDAGARLARTRSRRISRTPCKAQYTPDQWRPIAQSVFDRCARRKRDALVVIPGQQHLSLENSEPAFRVFPGRSRHGAGGADFAAAACACPRCRPSFNAAC